MHEFVIAPATGRGLWLLLIPVAAVLLPVIGVVGAAVAGARSARFDVSPEGLRLRGDVYGRLVDVQHLRGGAAQRVDFSRSRQLAPVRRTWGTGLPGYQSGWFRLRNGEKALLYLTDRSRAVYVPTTEGYSILLSPADPDGFLAALRAVNAQP